jgi:hypothetical protein
MLGQEANPRACRVFPERRPEQSAVAAARRDEAEQELERSRLPSAVRSQKAEHLAAADLEG